MAVTQYIGARYVPILADPVEWSPTKSYEPLTIVTHEGNSFTSRQYVPVGKNITDEDFWALTGNYNAQVEQYRHEVTNIGNKLPLSAFENGTVLDSLNDLGDLLPASEFDSTHTIKQYMDTMEDDIRDSTIVNERLQNAMFSPYTRTILEQDPSPLYTSFQVSTMDETESYIYVITPFTSSDQTTTKTSTLNVINPRSGAILSSTVMDVGHGRSLTCRGNLLLTSNQYATANNEWVCIDISDRINPRLVTRGNFDGRHIFWFRDGAACLDGAGNFRLLDVEYNASGYPVSFTDNGGRVPYNAGFFGEEQSFQYWNDRIIVASTLPEQITTLDADSGDILTHVLLKENYGFLSTSEVESAFIINDHLYFSNTSRLPKKADGSIIMEFSMFRCDFMEPKGELYDFWLGKSMQTQRGDNIQYVSGTSNPYSSVSADGSQEYPYRFVSDALIGYSSKFFMNRNGSLYEKFISIAFTNTTYDYYVQIVNKPFFVGINGAAESTQVPFIRFENSKGVVNRVNFTGITDNQVSTVNDLCCVYANYSDLRIINSTFPNSPANALSVLAKDFSNVMVAGPTNRLVANTFSSIKANSTIQHYTADTSSQVEIMVLPANNNVELFQVAGSNTQVWESYVRNNGDMYRMYITNTGLNLRYYPDATDLNTYETKWTLTAQV